jgi:mannosyltransferase OCH1-like enzyme
MPDYRIKEWNETNSPLDNAYSQRAYAKELWAKLSNHVRLHALYTEGGMYLDTDVEVIKSFAPLLHHKCFVGFQVEEEQVDWVNNAVLGAQPGHLFLKRCMELTQELFADTGEFYRSPRVTTTILKEMGLSEYGLQEIKEVTVYPAEYFCPYPWFGKFSPDCIKDNTYSIHYWEGSWLKKEHHKVLSPLRMVRRMMRTLTSKVD